MKEIDVITEIRGFNRFYTNLLGVLDQHILNSGYSLTEARILFELSKTEKCTANQLCLALEIDRSYMSRIIKKFEKDELIVRHASKSDTRNMEINLTEKGERVFCELNHSSDEQIRNMIVKLSETEKAELIAAIRVVKKHFVKVTNTICIRPFSNDDVEYIIERQLSLYEEERKFTSQIWKKYLTQGVLELVEKFDPQKDTIYIADFNGNKAGCIAITHTPSNIAQLRYFFLEPEMRGLGIGKALVNKALDFCREKNYTEVFLWTVSAQESARTLYKNAGFEICETHENNEWGTPVMEEKWNMRL